MVDKHFFCLPRSGSNYLAALVFKNYPESRHRTYRDKAFGKHDPNAKANGLTILFPWKLEPTWLNSMFRYTLANENHDWQSPARDFEEWLQAPIGSAKVGFFKKPSNLYTHFLYQALRLKKANKVIPVCYELLQEWPEATLKSLFGPCGTFCDVKDEALPSPDGAVHFGERYQRKEDFPVDTVDRSHLIEALYQ